MHPNLRIPRLLTREMMTLFTLRMRGVARYHYNDNNGRVGWSTPAGTCLPSIMVPCADIDAQDRLLRHGDIAFAYNARGQRVSRSEPGGPSGTLTTTYEYDEVGNLWRVVLPDDTVVSYRVDGVGRRVARFVDGVAQAYWLYQDGLNPIAQLDAAGNVTQHYVYATRVNVPDLIIAGGVTYRVLTDQVGSVRRVVNTATGATVLEREYSPYGVLEFENGSFEQPFGYAGGLEDSLTSLVRFGARDYDPEVGRWTTKDPILTDGGVNLYEYAASAPQMYVDPNGLWYITIGTSGIFGALTNGTSGGGLYFGIDDSGRFDAGFYSKAGLSIGPRIEGGVSGEIGISPLGSTDSIGGTYGGVSAGGKLLGGGGFGISSPGMPGEEGSEPLIGENTCFSGSLGLGVGGGASLDFGGTSNWSLVRWLRDFGANGALEAAE